MCHISCVLMLRVVLVHHFICCFLLSSKMAKLSNIKEAFNCCSRQWGKKSKLCNIAVKISIYILVSNYQSIHNFGDPAVWLEKLILVNTSVAVLWFLCTFLKIVVQHCSIALPLIYYVWLCFYYYSYSFLFFANMAVAHRVSCRFMIWVFILR